MLTLTKKQKTKTNGEKKHYKNVKKNKNKIKKIKREANNIFVLLTEGDNVYIFMKQLVWYAVLFSGIFVSSDGSYIYYFLLYVSHV